MSDNLWVRAIQDLDYCESKIAENQCVSKGWLFHMIDAATNLSPKFNILYSAGGLALSVLVSDIDGAAVIFEKGVKNFPHDWPLAHRAAFHAVIEEKNNQKAADYLVQAARVGGPSWFYSLAQNLYLKEGQVALAKRVLSEVRDSLNKEEEAKLIKRLAKRIADLENSPKK